MLSKLGTYQIDAKKKKKMNTQGCWLKIKNEFFFATQSSKAFANCEDNLDIMLDKKNRTQSCRLEKLIYVYLK